MSTSTTWSFDGLLGVYKNNFISDKLRYAALVESIWAQFVKPIDGGFGKNKGETVNIRIVNAPNIASNGRLSEQSKIPIDGLSYSSNSITVTEWGRGVEYTSLAEDLEMFDLDNVVQKRMKDSMKIIMDNAIGQMMRSTSNKITAVPTGSTTLAIETTGTPTFTATSNITINHIGELRDRMRDQFGIPYYEGEYHNCVASVRFLRGIKNDPNFKDWRRYLKPGDVIFNSEVGQIENVRFIETNNLSSLPGSVGTGGVLGEAVIFGEDNCVVAEVVPTEIRIPLPGQAGREKSVVWYGILEYGIPYVGSTFGMTRAIRITSA